MKEKGSWEVDKIRGPGEQEDNGKDSLSKGGEWIVALTVKRQRDLRV
jgi:hypothetical protein